MTRTRRTRGVGGLAQQATAIHDPSVPLGSEKQTVKVQEQQAPINMRHAALLLAEQ